MKKENMSCHSGKIWDKIIAYITMTICRWKIIEKSLLQKKMLHWQIFSANSVEFSALLFVWHDDNDSRIGFYRNNSEPNRIVIGFKFQVWL